MSFLAPLFLIGGAAIVGPIIFHLIRRTTRERTVFSSLMFLMPSPPRLSKRHRLEHILLLILRCAALALLALGFARPFLKQTQLNDPSAAQPKRIIVLVDVSASMRRAGLWDEARSRVDAVLRKVGPADQVALYTFDRQATALLRFEEWNRAAATDRVPLALSRLAAITPGWGGTHLGNALITAAEALAEDDAKNAPGVAKRNPIEGPRQIILVSDLQAGSRLDALQAYEWPKHVALQIEALKPRNPTNAGVQWVAEAADAGRPVDAAVRVRVSNSSDAKREQFKLGWARGADFAGAPIDAYVPPGQSRVFVVPVAGAKPASGAVAPKDIDASAVVALRGDDEDFDNSLYVIPPVQRHASVLWLGAEKADDTHEPLFFLRRAFFDTPRLAVKVDAAAPTAPLLADQVRAANVIFVSEALPENSANALHERTLEGQTIVVMPRSPAVASTLGTLLGRDTVRLDEIRPSNYAMFAEIDFQHPLFAPFSDPRFSDFTKIHVWRYRKIDLGGAAGAHVLAKFDSGDPALVEVPVGKGRVFVLAMGWQPEDSQLAVSSKFVPLLWSWLELSGGVATAPAQFFVGDTVPLPAGHAEMTVRAPNGATAALPATATEFAQTTQPGIYELTSAAGTQRFAVNLDANESRTAPLALDDLEQLGLPVVAAKPDVAAAKDQPTVLQGLEAENRQKLWRWLLAATVGVLLIESLLAGWTARRTAAIAEAEVSP